MHWKGSEHYPVPCHVKVPEKITQCYSANVHKQYHAPSSQNVKISPDCILQAIFNHVKVLFPTSGREGVVGGCGIWQWFVTATTPGINSRQPPVTATARQEKLEQLLRYACISSIYLSKVTRWVRVLDKRIFEACKLFFFIWYKAGELQNYLCRKHLAIITQPINEEFHYLNYRLL